MNGLLGQDQIKQLGFYPVAMRNPWKNLKHQTKMIRCAFLDRLYLAIG